MHNSKQTKNISHGSRSTNKQKMKRGRTNIEISAEELKKVLHYAQPQAAKILGVSLSTLKRKFYQLYPGRRWSKQTMTRNKLQMKFLVHRYNKPETYIESSTIHMLNHVFSNPNNRLNVCFNLSIKTINQIN
jgi:hypothetical protein